MNAHRMNSLNHEVPHTDTWPPVPSEKGTVAPSFTRICMTVDRACSRQSERKLRTEVAGDDQEIGGLDAPRHSKGWHGVQRAVVADP